MTATFVPREVGRPVLFEPDRRVPLPLRGSLLVVRPFPDGRHVPLHALERGGWCAMAVARALGQAVPPIEVTTTNEGSGVTLSTTLVRACLEAQPVLVAAA